MRENESDKKSHGQLNPIWHDIGWFWIVSVIEFYFYIYIYCYPDSFINWHKVVYLVWESKSWDSNIVKYIVV